MILLIGKGIKHSGPKFRKKWALTGTRKYPHWGYYCPNMFPYLGFKVVQYHLITGIIVAQS